MESEAKIEAAKTESDLKLAQARSDSDAKLAAAKMENDSGLNAATCASDAEIAAAKMESDAKYADLINKLDTLTQNQQHHDSRDRRDSHSASGADPLRHRQDSRDRRKRGPWSDFGVDSNDWEDNCDRKGRLHKKASFDIFDHETVARALDIRERVVEIEKLKALHALTGFP